MDLQQVIERHSRCVAEILERILAWIFMALDFAEEAIRIFAAVFPTTSFCQINNGLSDNLNQVISEGDDLLSLRHLKLCKWIWIPVRFHAGFRDGQEVVSVGGQCRLLLLGHFGGCSRHHLVRKHRGVFPLYVSQGNFFQRSHQALAKR